MAKGKYKKWLTPDGLTLMQGWAREGLIDDQIAHNMGIRSETLYQWKKQYPNISNALSRGKEIVNIEVENDLLKKGRKAFGDFGGPKKESEISETVYAREKHEHREICETLSREEKYGDFCHTV